MESFSRWLPQFYTFIGGSRGCASVVGLKGADSVDWLRMGKSTHKLNLLLYYCSYFYLSCSVASIKERMV